MVKRVHLILKSHNDALKFLSKAKGKNFEIVLKNTPSLIRAVKMLFQYILNGRLNMKQHNVQKLKRHRLLIRKIANGNVKSVRPHIQKGGSIIQSILSTVLPLLAAIL